MSLLFQDALTNPFVSGAIEEALGMKGDELIKMMESFSLVQTDDLEKMLYYSSMMLNYTDCVDLDRYVGVKDEKELEKVSAELGRNRKVMAGKINFLASLKLKSAAGNSTKISSKCFKVWKGSFLISDANDDTKNNAATLTIVRAPIFV